MPKVAQGVMESRKHYKGGHHCNTQHEELFFPYGNGCHFSPVDKSKPPLETGCFKCPFDDCFYDHNKKKKPDYQLALIK